MNDIPKFEDMPLPIQTAENYIKVLKHWAESWKKETESQIKELKEVSKRDDETIDRLLTTEDQNEKDYFRLLQKNKELEEEMEEFGRKCFYQGREIERYNEHGECIFKRPTYNGYLREIDKQ